eukprot:CAMPEP_0118919898 /NCGR_PEP_ID=MMETSP1166-20130328/18792_1 /TAXON_ID=1104430 /ORGANISM="Chrysoreinhardia sp, Strain CCMP3193" /LENGTH=40 /DNA_ID= /DNA_START= /DNA_END= /DNA_ORIENTATION=
MERHQEGSRVGGRRIEGGREGGRCAKMDRGWAGRRIEVGR